MARPTIYTDEFLETAYEYIKDCPDVIHTVVGLCLYVGISKSTAYKWAEEGKEAFSDILNTVAALQERKLVTNGLTNEFNASITKLMLTKHGYSDKVESTNTNIELSHEEWLDTLE
tara:strand:- start:262 stop:609 length:348 start_codon:yes stop_codon:yes gene_type:complete